MGKHTKIIELYGLPACGKSTLKNYLIEEYKDSSSFCCMTSLTEQYKRTSLFYKVRTFPYLSMVCLISLLFDLPFIFNKHALKIYSGFFILVLVYSYAKHQYIKDYVIIDHGIIQSAISVLYGKEYNLYQSSASIRRLCRKLNIDYLVYCSLDPNESCVRLRKRNRINSGRLDAISDNDLLNKYMQTQCKQFVLISSFYENGITLDMSKDISSITKTLHCYLINNKRP